MFLLSAEDHSSTLPPPGFGLHQGGGVSGRTTESNANVGIPLCTVDVSCVGAVCAMATAPLVPCLIIFDGKLSIKEESSYEVREFVSWIVQSACLIML